MTLPEQLKAYRYRNKNNPRPMPREALAGVLRLTVNNLAKIEHGQVQATMEVQQRFFKLLRVTTNQAVDISEWGQ